MSYIGKLNLFWNNNFGSDIYSQHNPNGNPPPIPPTEFLLLENGQYILLENSGKIILEID